MTLKLLNTEQALEKLVALIKGAKEEVTLVSPFVDLHGTDRVSHAIRMALSNGVRVILVFRFEEGSLPKKRTAENIGELIDKGMSIRIVPRVHAKMYWSESAVLITSLNLQYGAFVNNVEVAYWSEDREAVAEARSFYERELLPLINHDDLLRRAGKLGPADDATPAIHAAAGPTGHCIRCKTSIPLNSGEPYCKEDLVVWERFENPDFEDKFCHACGSAYPATMRHPLCARCYAGVR